MIRNTMQVGLIIQKELAQLQIEIAIAQAPNHSGFECKIDRIAGSSLGNIDDTKHNASRIDYSEGTCTTSKGEPIHETHTHPARRAVRAADRRFCGGWSASPAQHSQSFWHDHRFIGRCNSKREDYVDPDGYEFRASHKLQGRWNLSRGIPSHWPLQGFGIRSELQSA